MERLVAILVAWVISSVLIIIILLLHSVSLLLMHLVLVLELLLPHHDVAVEVALRVHVLHFPLALQKLLPCLVRICARHEVLGHLVVHVGLFLCLLLRVLLLGLLLIELLPAEVLVYALLCELIVALLILALIVVIEEQMFTLSVVHRCVLQVRSKNCHLRLVVQVVGKKPLLVVKPVLSSYRRGSKCQLICREILILKLREQSGLETYHFNFLKLL